MDAMKPIENERALDHHNPMKLSEYFFGRTVRIASQLEPAIIEDFINESAGSTLWPFSSGMVGWARFGFVRLRYQNSPLNSHILPILTGPLREKDGGSMLELVYRAPAFAYVFFLLWYLFVSLGTILSLPIRYDPTAQAADILSLFGMLLFFWILPILYFKFVIRKANIGFDVMVDFLVNNLEAREIQA
jgi:hypothetical protein